MGSSNHVIISRLWFAFQVARTERYRNELAGLSQVPAVDVEVVFDGELDDVAPTPR